jgi:sugar lactone lactonase YvrE
MRAGNRLDAGADSAAVTGTETGADLGVPDVAVPGDAAEALGPDGRDARVADEVGPDVRPDVPADVRTDVQSDVPADVRADTPPDVRADVQTEAGPPPTGPRLELLVGTLGGAGTADGVGVNARFHRPTGIASDGAGNLFVGDTDSYTVRKIAMATAAVTTIAGSPMSVGYAYGYGDGTAAARFDAPGAVAADGAGNLFVRDGCVLRKIVLATGVVTTLASSSESEICGVRDGAGAEVMFTAGGGLVSDGKGNLFSTDGDTVRKLVIATATVTTLAGSSEESGSADGVGEAARFKRPTGMALDGAGNLFVADADNYTIRKVVLATGEVTTVAGSPGQPGKLNGIRGAARFDSPSGLAYDGAGNLFVTDLSNRLIRKLVVATGEVSTVATGLTYPTAVVYDGSGNLFVTDGEYTIRKVVIATGEVTTFAGLPPQQGATAGTGGQSFVLPAGIASDGAGHLFVVDTDGQAVRKVAVATGNVTTLADPTRAYPRPRGVAYAGAGTLLVSDLDLGVIVKVPIATEAGSLVAGGSKGEGIQDGTGAAARFSFPEGVTSDGAGNAFVADFYGQTIRKVVIATGEVTTLAGSSKAYGSADGKGQDARFSQPLALVYDGVDSLFVADTANATIRKVVIATGEVSTLAGSPQVYASVDGVGADARFMAPIDVAVDGKGNLFVLDDATVRKIVIATKTVSTVVGRPGQRGVILGPLPAGLNAPGGIAMGPSGELFITDSVEPAVLVARF